jgi:muramoyltetrapeptide carboxypeptidase
MPVLDRFREAGYKVKLAPNAFKKKGYVAGDDQERLRGFSELMADSSVDAVMALRGGYGCLRLLPTIENWDSWSKFKPIIGFSDITALHLARWAKTKVGGWHAPVVNSLVSEPIAASFFQTLKGQGAKAWVFKKSDCLSEGEGIGPLLGGNLSTINSMLESDFLPSFEGAIVLLEDIGEPDRRLDRLFTTLTLSGRLKNIKGLVLGSFSQCGPPSLVNKLSKDLSSLFSKGVPVVKGAPFGHQTKNFPWWYGSRAQLTVNNGVAKLCLGAQGSY